MRVEEGELGEIGTDVCLVQCLLLFLWFLRRAQAAQTHRAVAQVVRTLHDVEPRNLTLKGLVNGFKGKALQVFRLEFHGGTRILANWRFHHFEDSILLLVCSDSAHTHRLGTSCHKSFALEQRFVPPRKVVVFDGQIP